MWSYLVQIVAEMSTAKLAVYTILAIVLYVGIGIQMYGVFKTIAVKSKIEDPGHTGYMRWCIISSWPIFFFFCFLVVLLIVLAVLAVIALILGIIYAIISFIVSVITLILSFFTGIIGLILGVALVVLILATAIVICYFLINSPFVIIKTIIKGLKGEEKAPTQTIAAQPGSDGDAE